MARWNREEFELPDVAGFQDYISGERDYVAELGRRLNESPGRLLLFPYANGPMKLRPLAVIDLADLALYSAAAGRIAGTTDPLLSSRVLSCRLAKSPPCWRFRDPKKWHQKFRQRAIDLLRSGGQWAMCCTDVERYYGSVDRAVLQHALSEWRCDQYAVTFLLRLLCRWQVEHNLIGLPIGSDASRVLGNALLMPIDVVIHAMEAEHLRWMDDILIFGKTTASCEAALAAAGVELTGLGLRLSLEKTRKFDNPGDAIAYIEDGMLASLSWLSAHALNLADSQVRDAFDREVRGNPSANPKHFRWILRFLKNRNDPYAAMSLAERPDVMNVDPQVTGAYLGAIGLNVGPVVDNIMGKLSGPAQDRTDALDLHVLRAAKEQAWGSSEGNVFRQIAMDDTRRAPVRCWAWQAHSRSSAWSEKEAMESADAEADSMVRRAIVISMRRKDECRRARTTFFRDVENRFPELRYTTRWVEAA